MNTTKLLLHSSYLVRWDCFSNAFDNWWVIAALKDLFGRNMHKNVLFLLKNCKNHPALGSPQAPLPPAAETPAITQHWEFQATPLNPLNIHTAFPCPFLTPLHLCLFILLMS